MLVDDSYAGSYSDEYYTGCILEITGGTGAGEHALITSFTGATCTFTFSALSGGTTPDSTTEFIVGHRYALPQDFGGDIEGPIRYLRDTNHGSHITWADWSKLAALRENVGHTSYPYLAAVQPYGDRRWELQVYPDPTSADVIYFPYLKYFNDMGLVTGTATTGGATSIVDTALSDEFTDDAFNGGIITILSGTGKGGYATITDYVQSTNTISFSGGFNNGITADTTSVYVIEKDSRLHPAGMAFDTFIVSACLAQTEQVLEDVYGGWSERYNSDLYRAKQKDNRSVPKTLGKMRLPTAAPPERIRKDVTFT
jgi:hypothetical protein